MDTPAHDRAPASASGPWWHRRTAFVTLVVVPALLALAYLGYRIAIPDPSDELPALRRDPTAESPPPSEAEPKAEHPDAVRPLLGPRAPDHSQAEAKPEDPDEKHRRLVVGVWEDDYKGKRKMVLHADGTGTMLVEPGGAYALFAARLRFDMVWSVEDGRLNKRTVGGEPESKVNLILETMGDRVSEPILELNDQRLLLLDKDGETRYDWRRVE